MPQARSTDKNVPSKINRLVALHALQQRLSKTMATAIVIVSVVASSFSGCQNETPTTPDAPQGKTDLPSKDANTNTGINTDTQGTDKESTPAPTGPTPEDIFNEFVDANLNPDPETWQEKHDAIYNLKEKAVPVLRKNLLSEEINNREAAAVILVQFGTEAEPAKKELETVLKSDDPELIRVHAAASLVLIPEPCEELVPSLKKFIHSEDAAVQDNAIYAFENLGSVALEPLIDLLMTSSKLEARKTVLNAYLIDFTNRSKERKEKMIFELAPAKERLEKLSQSQKEPEELKTLAKKLLAFIKT